MPRARGYLAGAGLPLVLEATTGPLALVSPVSPPTPLGMDARSATQVPILSRRHVRRPRLTRMLDSSSAQALILTAPAGYGKTSLVCEWLEGQPNVAWYRATSASADLAAFSAGIAEVMEPFLPGAGDRVRLPGTEQTREQSGWRVLGGQRSPGGRPGRAAIRLDRAGSALGPAGHTDGQRPEAGLAVPRLRRDLID